VDLTSAEPPATVCGTMRRPAVVLLLLVLAGCGSTPAAPDAGSPGERFWAGQALTLLDGLGDALPRIRNAGVGPDTLRNGSYLYDALLGYTYVDSCGAQLGNLGQPSRRELDASKWLHEACAHLRHASTLFTRAVKLERSALLVTAASEALATAPLLRKARVSLTQLR
jgi:hypothetical protein